MKISKDFTYEPDAAKFRQIAEAYAVLSIIQSKTSYDLSQKKIPDMIYKSKKDAEMEKQRRQRDNSGHVPAAKPKRGSYAEQRLRELKDEREKFNVNHLGYYNGGLPIKGKLNLRRSSTKNIFRGGDVKNEAVGSPGAFHCPTHHNMMEMMH